MKHFTSFLCSILLSIFSLSAQNFELVYNGNTVADGDVLSFQATVEDLTDFIPDFYIIEASTNNEEHALNIRNTTNKPLDAEIEVEILESIEGTECQLCTFMSCVQVADKYKTSGTIAANSEEATAWHASFTYGNEGVIKTKLTVTAGGQTQSVYVNFVYGEETGISDLYLNNTTCKVQDGTLHVESNSILKSYQIYALDGSLYAQGALNGYKENISLPCQGAYLVKITTATGSKTVKIITD